MDNVCKEKHIRIDERLKGHDERLDSYGKRISILEQGQTKMETEIKNLCGQIQSLVKAIWWSIGLTVTSLLGFFIWYIQGLRG